MTKQATERKVFTFECEYTDTFGGEPNYCWVNRFKVQAETMAGAVRKAKAHVGLTGVRCRREDLTDYVALYPNGCNTALFINDEF